MVTKTTLVAAISLLCLSAAPYAIAEELPVSMDFPTVNEQPMRPADSVVEHPGASEIDVVESEAISDNVVVVQPVVEEQQMPAMPVVQQLEFIAVKAGDAIFEVQKDVTAGGMIRMRGSGWKTQTGTGSTVTIKLNFNRDGQTGQYQRIGEGVLSHPGNGSKDATIFWQIAASADGSFEVEESLPNDLVAGQGLKLNVASGLVVGDVQRSVTTPSLVVDDIPYVEPINDKEKCIPSVSPPQATVASEPAVDGTLYIEAQGFCNTNGGGAKVAIKIDDGKVQRLDSTVHDNHTIWAIVDADPKTGNFSINLPLPDGSTSGPQGSKTAFEQGEHTIRLLSGSLQEGDIAASVPLPGTKLSFTVGKYRPTTVPDPINYQEKLTSATQKGVTARRVDNDVAITIPGRKIGDWVYVSVYLENGSRRLPWKAEWFRLDTQGSVLLPATEAIPPGQLRLVAQSGNKGEFGALLGWADIKYRDGTNAAPGRDKSTTTSQALSPATKIDGSLKGLNSAIEGFGVALVDSLQKYKKSVVKDGSNNIAIEAEMPSEAVNNGTFATNDNVVAAPAMASTAVPVVANSGIRHTAAVGVSAQPVATANTAAGAAVNSKPKPTHEPKKPVKDRDQLTNDNSFNASGIMAGEVLAMKVPKIEAGTWAFLYVYPADTTIDPQPAGWVQLDAQQVVRIETAALPDGEYTVSAQNANDELVGWVDIVLGAGSEPLVNETGYQAAASPNTTVQAKIMTPIDWWLLGVSALIPALSAGALYLYRRKERRNV